MNDRTRWSTGASVLAVAAVYFISGRLGLLLAIPPGYATAVWPASGIALAAVLHFGFRVWPGIWLGSFMINVGTALDPNDMLSLMASTFPAVFIALGAVLQAVIGAVLIQRRVGYSNLLTQEMGSVWILLWGGPLACLISASVGVSTLWMYGLIPNANVLVSWWTWWIGDSVGVLIFTPLLLVWVARPYRLWFIRQLYVSLPLVLMFVLVVSLFVLVSRHESTRLKTNFNVTVTDFERQAQNSLQDYLNVLYSLQSFFNVVHDVDPEDFRLFADHLLRRLPGVQALSWNPRIEGADRTAFEQRESARGMSIHIHERDPTGGARGAALRDEYVPVQYIAPLPGNQSVIGFDVASEPTRVAALERAALEGRPVGTAPMQLVQHSDGKPGVVVFMPVYHPGQRLNTPEQRRLNLRGYVAAVFLVDDVLASVVQRLQHTGVELNLYDNSEGSRLPLWTRPVQAMDPDGGFSRRLTLNFADRQWQADLYVPAAYLVEHRSWETWILLASGMLFTGLLGMFLLVMIGRSAAIEQQVADRTVELTRVNEVLVHETQRSEKLEAESRQRAAELAASNQDLDQFASVASHDLQAPLRSMSGFVDLLERRYRTVLQADGEGHQIVAAIRKSCSDMQGLIESILRLSRLSREPLEFNTVDLVQVLDRAQNALAQDFKISHAEIRSQPLPTVRGDARLLTQLFQNLIGNAIKFQPAGQHPRVEIGAVRRENEWNIWVRDNGIGIADEHLGHLFQMFRRVNADNEYSGHGIGLALCKKIVRLHQGRIWAESVLGKGTTIYFTLPVMVTGGES